MDFIQLKRDTRVRRDTATASLVGRVARVPLLLSHPVAKTERTQDLVPPEVQRKIEKYSSGDKYAVTVESRVVYFVDESDTSRNRFVGSVSPQALRILEEFADTGRLLRLEEFLSLIGAAPKP